MIEVQGIQNFNLILRLLAELAVKESSSTGTSLSCMHSLALHLRNHLFAEFFMHVTNLLSFNTLNCNLLFGAATQIVLTHSVVSVENILPNINGNASRILSSIHILT